MKMKKFSILLVLFCLVFVLPTLAEDNDKKVDIKLKVGVESNSTSDFDGKVNEYSATDDGVKPILKAKIKGNSGKTFFQLFSDFRGDADQMTHLFKVDFSRVLRQKFQFDSLYHRLDHDGLTNIDTISEARSAAYSEDLNPTDNYHITRREFTSNTQLMIPGLPIKFYVDFRNEQRKGQYQARTLSKCSSCHVVAQTRAINNTNRDIRIGSNFRVGKATVDYSFTHNQFTEKEAAPTSNFLKIQHPESLAPVFTSRIAYGNNEALTIDTSPDSKKDTHLILAAIPFSANSTISAQYLNSTVTNENYDLKWKSSSFAGGFSTLFSRKAIFNLRFQQIKVTNDSIYIDMNEPVDVAGPKVGMTYGEAYGAEFDYTRLSALSRTVLDIDANFRYRFNKKLKLRLGYEFKKVDRENYDVETTKSSTFKARLKLRPVKQLRLTLEGKFKTISDPFSNRFAASSPSLQTTAYPNPFIGVQFFQWHEQRLNHLSNLPETATELKGKVNWSPSARFALNGNIVYRTEKNDAVDDFANGLDAHWSRDSFQWGIDMWAALGEKFPLTASYYNYTNKYDSLFSVPVIEGCGAGVVQGMTGSLTDMFGYDIETQTVLVNLHYLAAKNIKLHMGFSYNNSLSEMVELALNEEQLAYIPGSPATELDFNNMGEVAEYSMLEMKQIMAELGISFKVSKSLEINGSVFYYFYDDMTEYLFEDTTGKKYSFFAGLTWSN